VVKEIIDAKTRFRYIKGGYSPKVYDGHFLKLMKEDLLSKFIGGVVLADNAFEYGKKLLGKDIKFYTNITTRSKKETGDDSISDLLYNKHKSYNKQHQSARARVEAPSGIVKTMFKSLNEPWLESEIQQDHLFHIACAIHNIQT